MNLVNSFHSENFEQAVQDFQKAVDIKISLCAEDNRERAEAHYKLALALEYSEQIEAAIEHVNLSFAVLQKRLDSLREAVDPKGKSSDVGAESTSKEAEEIETSLFPEMEAKLADLTAALEKEASGGVIGEDQEPEAAEPAVVQDISKLVKRKVDPVVEDDEAKKARIN